MIEICSKNEARIELLASKTAHAELFSAFEYGETLTFRLFAEGRFERTRAYISILRDEDGKELTFEGEKCDGFFRFVVNTADICADGASYGLFYYAFVVEDLVFAQNGDREGLIVCGVKDHFSRFQLTVYKEGSNKETGYEGGIMYQIFPDRFFKAGKAGIKEGAVMEQDWYAPISEYHGNGEGKLLNNHFFGGTLWGVSQKLDYLKSLGVTLLYLNPIFRSSSNHRYDTGDYLEVDELLGGNKAFDELVKKAREKGIGIILDGVFNHTGADSRYFNRYGRYPSAGAYQSEDSPYHDWYFFSEFPDKYECWWGFETLPKLNGNNEKCRAFIAGENGVVERALRAGTVGWRLDVVDELPDVMIDAIRERSSAVNENALVYGEVWEDASNKCAYSQRRHYFSGGQLNAVMNYPLKNALIEYLTSGDAAFLYDTVRILYNHYPKAASDLQMNILSTHDTERILTLLGGAPEMGQENRVLAQARLCQEERAHAKKLLSMAVLLQMTLPGIPCIYYGDEIGMEGYKDPFNRAAYPWGREDGEVLAFYREAAALRRSLPMLGQAYYRGVSSENGVYVFERFNDQGESLTVIANLSGNTYLYRYDGEATLLPVGIGISDSVAVDNEKVVCLYQTDVKRKDSHG